VSWTAAQNKRPVRGILPRRIAVVKVPPSSGSPEDSSKTHPTAAMAEMQEIRRKTPLLGVTGANL
jgi:hypothetical protein